MGYAGECDPTPVPEPRTRPVVSVLLDCGHVVEAVPYWSSDPIYGGWKPPAFARCGIDGTASVRRRAEASEITSSPGQSEATDA